MKNSYSKLQEKIQRIMIKKNKQKQTELQWESDQKCRNFVKYVG
jgi:hypothetical protein